MRLFIGICETLSSLATCGRKITTSNLPLSQYWCFQRMIGRTRLSSLGVLLAAFVLAPEAIFSAPSPQLATVEVTIIPTYAHYKYFRFSLVRTRGECRYDATISNDKKVIVRRGRISSKEAEHFAAGLDGSGVWSLKDHMAMAPDFPFIIVVASRDRQATTVRFQGPSPHHSRLAKFLSRSLVGRVERAMVDGLRFGKPRFGSTIQNADLLRCRAGVRSIPPRFRPP